MGHIKPSSIPFASLDVLVKKKDEKYVNVHSF
jgi:hypothetical protein